MDNPADLSMCQPECLQPERPAEAPTQPHDGELLARIAQGEEDALAILYDRFGSLVFGLALRITGDRLTAEEVMQDVFARVWHHHSTFQSSVGTVKAWIMGITRHRAIDRVRSARFTARHTEVPLNDTLLAVRRDGSRFEQQVALQDELRVALDALAASQRQAIELTYYGDLTTLEIAAVTGIPVGTVKSRLRRGLVALRTALSSGCPLQPPRAHHPSGQAG